MKPIIQLNSISIALLNGVSTNTLIMAECRTVNKLEFNLYGFKGNKWLLCKKNKNYKTKTFCCKVNDEFSLSDIISWDEHWEEEQQDYHIRGVDVETKSGTLELRNYCHLPYDHDDTYEDNYNVKLYPQIYIAIDTMLDLAETLNIEIPEDLTKAADFEYDDEFRSDSNSRPSHLGESIEYVMNDISVVAKENHQMLDLIKGKDMFNLLDNLNRAKCDLEAERKAHGYDNDKIAKLEAALKKSESENTLLKQQLSESQNKVKELTAIQDTYKQQLIATMKEALSKM